MQEIHYIDYKDPSLLLMEEYEIAIKIDRDKKVLHASDIYRGEIDYTTTGVLKEVSPTLGFEIESYYKIQLKDYGIIYQDVIFDIVGV